jgi:L-rhamnose-H+ transport protein
VPGGAKIVILAGIAVCIAGVVVCGKAGILRESKGEQQDAGSSTKARKLFLVGLLWCVLSGFLSAGANLGFHFGAPLGEEAAKMGVSPLFASIPQWLPMWWGGYLANLIFLGTTMLKGRTWTNFSGAGSMRDFGLAVSMGTMHFLGQTTYGIGAHYLGKVGTSVGWAISIALSLIVANAFGFATGEWKKAPRRSVSTLYMGLLVLVLAIVLLAIGNKMAS